MLPYLLPVAPKPITIVGAGGIVRDAHLPAYDIAGFPIHGICDLDTERAHIIAKEFGIDRVYANAAEAFHCSPTGTVFDLAVPPGAILEVLEHVPEGSAVLIQKPLGREINEARAIRALCRRKNLKAAVNFQLRYAPAIMVARKMIDGGEIGEVHDMEVRITVLTPWSLWPFLEGLPRVEIPLHSIHYVDLIRSFFGEPDAVWARTLRHPDAPRLSSARSNIIMDHGDMRRANITTNHGHRFGMRHQESYVKWEGARGAIKARLGLLMDYPRGAPDIFEYCVLEENRDPEWRTLEIEGSWFPHAFIGTMSALQCFVEGSAQTLSNSVEDGYRTMEVVEAAYRSNDGGGTPVSHD